MRHAWLLVIVGVAAVAALLALPPVAEPPALRSLVDDRTFLGVPNFWNVVSNVPLLLAGLWGLVVVVRRPQAFADAAERWPYIACFASVALTAAGSAYFHLAPGDARLMWDRLPISIGFMALLSAVICERMSAAAGRALLVPLMIAGAGSVAYWRSSALHGAENILPYALVQYGAIAAMLILASRFPSRYSRGNDLLGALAIYGLAKAAEVLDAAIYAFGSVVSGHTLKHLLAALAVASLVRMLRLRKGLRP